MARTVQSVTTRLRAYFMVVISHVGTMAVDNIVRNVKLVAGGAAAVAAGDVVGAHVASSVFAAIGLIAVRFIVAELGVHVGFGVFVGRVIVVLFAAVRVGVLGVVAAAFIFRDLVDLVMVGAVALLVGAAIAFFFGGRFLLVRGCLVCAVEKHDSVASFLKRWDRAFLCGRICGRHGLRCVEFLAQGLNDGFRQIGARLLLGGFALGLVALAGDLAHCGAQAGNGFSFVAFVLRPLSMPALAGDLRRARSVLLEELGIEFVRSMYDIVLDLNLGRGNYGLQPGRTLVGRVRSRFLDDCEGEQRLAVFAEMGNFALSRAEDQGNLSGALG